MTIDERQYKAISEALGKGDNNAAAKNLGAWATKDEIGSVADVRGNLAVSSEWKSGQLYVVEFTAKPGVGVREGSVGPMWDANVKVELPGGGRQANFMLNSPRERPDLYQIDLSSLKPLPATNPSNLTPVKDVLNK